MLYKSLAIPICQFSEFIDVNVMNVDCLDSPRYLKSLANELALAYNIHGWCNFCNLSHFSIESIFLRFDGLEMDSERIDKSIEKR